MKDEFQLLSKYTCITVLSLVMCLPFCINRSGILGEERCINITVEDHATHNRKLILCIKSCVLMKSQIAAFI